MFQSRRAKAEKEAKEDPNYRPTKDLKCEEEVQKTPIPWGMIIFISIVLVLIVTCMIIIFIFKGQ